MPLFASLLIPLLVLWLNSVEDGNFAIDSFELTNISIGCLFAVGILLADHIDKFDRKFVVLLVSRGVDRVAANKTD